MTPVCTALQTNNLESLTETQFLLSRHFNKYDYKDNQGAQNVIETPNRCHNIGISQKSVFSHWKSTVVNFYICKNRISSSRYNSSNCLIYRLLNLIVVPIIPGEEQDPCEQGTQDQGSKYLVREWSYTLSSRAAFAWVGGRKWARAIHPVHHMCREFW